MKLGIDTIRRWLARCSFRIEVKHSPCYVPHLRRGLLLVPLFPGLRRRFNPELWLSIIFTDPDSNSAFPML